jgi:hypothetical protein
VNDSVERLLATQVGTSCGHLSDGDGHRGVVGPFTGFPGEASAAGHGDLKFWAARRTEFVWRTQGITRCGGQQYTDGTVELSGRQFHWQTPFIY